MINIEYGRPKKILLQYRYKINHNYNLFGSFLNYFNPLLGYKTAIGLLIQKHTLNL